MSTPAIMPRVRPRMSVAQCLVYAELEGRNGWLTRTFGHIELAPILTVESGQPVNPSTGLDSNQNHAFRVEQGVANGRTPDWG